jgi:hypothetical protein
LRLDCYPKGINQLKKTLSIFKQSSQYVGFHCLSFYVPPSSKTAEDGRLLKFSDGRKITDQHGNFIPNAELAGVLGQRLAAFSDAIGFDQKGGGYFDYLDLVSSSNITDPATGKQVADTGEIIHSFLDAYLTARGGGPAEGSMPSVNQRPELSHYQAWDPPATGFGDWLSAHRGDLKVNAGPLVKNLGWWQVEKMTAAEVLQGLQACEEDAAIWSLNVNKPIELLGPEHSTKLGMLKWWNINIREGIIHNQILHRNRFFRRRCGR